MSEWQNPEPGLLTWRDYEIRRECGSLALRRKGSGELLDGGPLCNLKISAATDYEERLELGEVKPERIEVNIELTSRARLDKAFIQSFDGEVRRMCLAAGETEEEYERKVAVEYDRIAKEGVPSLGIPPLNDRTEPLTEGNQKGGKGE